MASTEVSCVRAPRPRKIALIFEKGRLGRGFGATDPVSLLTFSNTPSVTHPISRLNVTLDSGEQLKVIFKGLQPRPDRDVRRRILIHRRPLADGCLDAPTVYASVCDEAQGRYWLFP
jgi:hypothetical protein